MNIILPPYRSARAIPTILGIVSIIIAIGIFSGILFGNALIEEEETLLIIDRSLSMLAEDISYNGKALSRLERAKSLAKNSIGHSTAMITYAKEADLLSPMTDDLRTLTSLIDRITPAEISGGSDLSRAVELTHTLYGNIGHLRVIIFTDGGSTKESEKLSFPPSWDVLIVGLGGDSLTSIPLGYDAQGEKRYKYASGSLVRVRYERENITKYARTLSARVIHEDSYEPLAKQSFPRDTLMILAVIFLLFGLLCHPYVRFSH